MLQKILFVDDEQNMRVAIYEALSHRGYAVTVAENGRTALELLAKTAPDLVVTDIRMPEMDGIELLQQIKTIRPELPVVIITGYATVETAVKAMQQGAVDYILKPFQIEVIEEVISKVFKPGHKALVGRVKPLAVSLARGGSSGAEPPPIIGRDRRFLRLLERAKTVASSKATVLMLGESGTGKEVFARFIHQASDRRACPFVALNCAALPESLLESELFGHEKGAFTGAVMARKGKFELAHGGTLLLDEIGEVPLHLQAKLLRVLQEEEVDRLGGREPIKIDVHVLATTNRDLAVAVKEGSFRQDLYYRLNVIPMRLPSLRERREDIPLLTDFFLKKHTIRHARTLKKLSSRSLKRFLGYPWPGNIRELANLVERAVLLSIGEELEPWDFWDEEMPSGLGRAISVVDSSAPSAGFVAGQLGDGAGPSMVDNLGKACAADKKTLNSTCSPTFRGEGGTSGEQEIDLNLAGHSLRDVERHMILQALRQTEDNRTHAAKMLGISVRTLRNKLNEYRSQGVM
ncbi:MAG: sigma-54-dependent Fis family transcriptional regulator [Desulfobulbaceae bacterium]|nr:MAG: sigma-54-dependent Fis family transcriptional regulator [Desulfobulbaceae bacterium]